MKNVKGMDLRNVGNGKGGRVALGMGS